MTKGNKEKLIKSVLPVNEMTWLVQPITVTVSKFDYDPTQTKFLVAMIECMQESIKKSITNNVEQLPLFSDGNNDNELTMKIPLKSWCIDPRRDPEIKQSLIKLATTPFEMPVKDEEGRNYIRYAGLCEVYMPDEKYVRTVIVKIKKDVALSLIDAKVYGYQKYLKQVITKTKNKYTQRLYFFVTSWKSQGETKIQVEKLRSMLRLENKYLRWNAFYNSVIKTAEKELIEKFEAGLSECYFEASPVYKKGQKNGTPDYLHFKIFVSKQEKENMKNLTYTSLKIRTDESLRVDFKIKVKRQREQLLRMINQDNIHLFSDFLIELGAKIESENSTITDVGAYAFTSCQRFLLKNTPEAEIVPDTPKEEEFGDERIFAKEIEAFRKAMKKNVGEEAYITWFTPVRFVKIDKVEGGYDLTLEVPSKFVYDMIESKYLAQLRESLQTGFKKKIVSLKYRMPN